MFEPMNFVANLSYMGTGMVAIFVVIGVIILVTEALNKITSDMSEEQKDSENK